MKISGLVKNSFVDYPGKIAAVVFTKGCNMDCVYCHNAHLLNDEYGVIDNNKIISFLKKRINKVEAVVISGGEPTIQKGLIQYIKSIRELGFLVKLDTNGTDPGVINDLIKLKLVDYIAMDIKATDKKYSEICRASVNIKSIRDSIKLIMSSNLNYEFRTTCYPSITNEDIFDIAKRIKGANRFALQRCRNPAKNYEYENMVKNKDFFNNLKNNISNMFGIFELRGIR